MVLSLHPRTQKGSAPIVGIIVFALLLLGGVLTLMSINKSQDVRSKADYNCGLANQACCNITGPGRGTCYGGAVCVVKPPIGAVCCPPNYYWDSATAKCKAQTPASCNSLSFSPDPVILGRNVTFTCNATSGTGQNAISGYAFNIQGIRYPSGSSWQSSNTTNVNVVNLGNVWCGAITLGGSIAGGQNTSCMRNTSPANNTPSNGGANGSAVTPSQQPGGGGGAGANGTVVTPTTGGGSGSAVTPSQQPGGGGGAGANGTVVTPTPTSIPIPTPTANPTNTPVPQLTATPTPNCKSRYTECSNSTECCSGSCTRGADNIYACN